MKPREFLSEIADLAAGFRQKIELELEKVCEDVLSVLDESLIPKAETGESKVFYHKMYVDEASRISFALSQYKIKLLIRRLQEG